MGSRPTLLETCSVFGVPQIAMQERSTRWCIARPFYMVAAMSLVQRTATPIAIVLLAAAVTACVHVSTVKATELEPQYVHPVPTTRVEQPLVVVYSPSELPSQVEISAPTGSLTTKLLDAPTLVTKHLRAGLESLFAHVTVTTDPRQVPTGAIICTVHFVDVGLILGPSGKTLLGSLEWSVVLRRGTDPTVLYSWGDRIVGSREGTGNFGFIDPSLVIQGAIEASLRTMLKDMNDKGVPALFAEPASAP